MTAITNISNILKNYKFYENAFLPKTVKIILNQDKQIDYSIKVKVGDAVKEGEVIAEYIDSGNQKVNIHSPIPGTVEDFKPVISPNGKYEYSIVIKLFGTFSYLGKKSVENSVQAIYAGSVANKLIEKGVVNTFLLSDVCNLGIQINKIRNTKNANLVVRMYDEDQYRLTDSLMSKFFLNQILQGAQLLSDAIDAKGVVFAIDKRFENTEEIQKCGLKNFQILPVNTENYPNGFKREIINQNNKYFKKSGFSINKNDLFVDSSTLYEVYKAVVCELPSIEKYIHFTGNCIYSSCLLNVKIGTSIKEIVNQIGGFEKEPNLVIINGHEVGNSITDIDIPVTKETKSIEFVSSRKATDSNIYGCVNCGNCRESCPVNLSPDILYKYTVTKKEVSKIFIDSAVLCNNCGLCNTVCPSRLPLSQMINILNQENKEKKAEDSIKNESNYSENNIDEVKNVEKDDKKRK